MTVRQRLKAAARSIGLAYARAFVAFAGAAYVGALDPSRKLDAVWALLVGAAWSALPAGLRAAEAILVAQPKPQSLAWRIALSFGRAMVATAVMAVAGPITGARQALNAVLVAVVPAVLRAVQEALEATATPDALARRGRAAVAAVPLPPPAPDAVPAPAPAAPADVVVPGAPAGTDFTPDCP